MKIQAISSYGQINRKNLSQTSSVKNISQINTEKKPSHFIQISFTGNAEKNFKQFASIAPEHAGVGLKMYYTGGLACVTGEAPNSLINHNNADARTFLPYHSFDNESGGLKVLKVNYDNNKKPILNDLTENFKSVPQNYVLKDGESFVIQDEAVNGKSPFRILEETGISGRTKRIADNLNEMEEIPYRLFELKGAKTKDKIYIIHTKELAKLPKAYGIANDSSYGSYGVYGSHSSYGSHHSSYGAYGSYGSYGGGNCTDLSYADFDRAVVDALPKMNYEKYGNFNPANIWLHDRTAFVTISDMADKSANGEKYFNGLKIHSTLHNPGRNYQGVYENPIEFFKLVAGENDLNELKKNCDFNFLKEIDTKTVRGQFVTDLDKVVTKNIMDPILQNFIDETGRYNLSMATIAGVKLNPQNMSAGTVSMNYGKEMADELTSEMAEGLTNKLASIKTINITNGSTPANMGFNNPHANFGKGMNILSENKSGFNTFKPLIENNLIKNLDEILTAKQLNKKWLINTIADNAEKSNYALSRVFFNDSQISPAKETNLKPSTVLGSLSKYEDGDKLFISWGRPDPQKGYPTILQGFLNVLKDETIPETTKKHSKLLLGAGADPWSSDDIPDWKKIKSLVNEIQTLDGGKYKGNVCYVNGLFPNRLVGCADFSIFTSRYEPCGITPLESFSAGTPTISIRTGGAPDFVTTIQKGGIDKATGFLTQKPFLVNANSLGLPENVSAEKLDKTRIKSSAQEIAQEIKKALSLDEISYKKMSENAFLQKIDWHENAAFNGGRSANTRYLEEVFDVTEDLMPKNKRNINPLNKLIETVSSNVQNAIKTSGENIEKSAKEFAKKNKKIMALIFATSAAISGIVILNATKKAKSLSKNKIIETQNLTQNQNTPNTQTIQKINNPFSKTA